MRNLLLAAMDLAALAAAWALALWGYWVVGLGYYKFGWTFYLRLWPVVVAFVTVNAFFRLYHGNAFSPAAPVAPSEELRRLTGSAVLVHIGLIAGLALAYQTTEGFSRAVILIAGTLTAVLAQPFRDAVRGLIKRRNLGQIPVTVFGEPDGRLRRFFDRDAYIGFVPVPDRTDSDVAVVCGAVLFMRGAR